MVGSLKTTRQKLRQLTEAKFTSGERSDALFRLINETSVSDCMVVLIACELLNLAITEAIRATLRQDDSEQIDALFGGPGKDGLFITFGERARVAYALNVFGPETLADLNLLRYVRNAFAHSRVAVSFENAEVADMCRHFNIIAVETEEDERVYKEESARYWFVAACTFLHSGILNTTIERFIPWEAGSILAIPPADGLYVRASRREAEPLMSPNKLP